MILSMEDENNKKSKRFFECQKLEGFNMAKKKQAKSSEEEQVGFHKGALSTLAKEREEMKRILAIVEQLMQMHLKALKELGIDLEEEAKKIKKQAEPLESKI